jgi:hypothetical protein
MTGPVDGTGLWLSACFSPVPGVPAGTYMEGARAMDNSLRELGERDVGTRDFNPQIPLTRLDRAAGISEAEPATETSDERCASLYDAIRDMSAYGSRREAEKRRGDGDGLLRSP